MKPFSTLIFVAGMIILFLLPVSRYSWIYDVDPTMAAGGIIDSSGNGLIFSALVLLSIAIVQTISFVKAKGKKEKSLTVLLVFIAVSFWLFKFIV